jgi:hypothetical protein
MEGQVDDLTSLNLGSSIDHFCEGRDHFGIGIGLIGFRIRFVVTQADCGDVNSVGISEREFVPQALFFSEVREEFGSQIRGRTQKAYWVSDE